DGIRDRNVTGVQTCALPILTIAGGGLRYEITKTDDKPLTPHFLLATSAHSVVHSAFSASHFGANLIASVGIPQATTYLGAGFDRSEERRVGKECRCRRGWSR